MKRIFVRLAVCFVAMSAVASAEKPVLEKGDRLAIIGDSITEQKLYSKFIETYLLACYPEFEIQTFQFGWGGERAPGFASRMENDLVPWKPDVVTTCYGMNDGSYRAYDEQIGKTYEEGMRRIIDRMKKTGATVVVGSPGVVDSFTWNRNNPEFDQVYNDDIASGMAEATDGHKVLSSKNGIVEIESTRYPFCFFGGEKDPNGTASILPYTPFNQDLNRFTLKVKGLLAAQADVTFGSATKTFSKDQLTDGINLADEFIDNPFVQPFNRVLDEVGLKQAAETAMIKGFITHFRQLGGPLAEDPEVQSALNTIRRKMTETDNAAHAKAKAAVKPVSYRLVIKPKA